MKLISFDVGIKNMAYCIFTISGEQMFSIDQWDVLNLTDQSVAGGDVKPICNCILVAKNKRTPPKTCAKAAKFSKNGKYYCEKHAKECSQFILPKKEYSQSSLRKLNLTKLNDIAATLGITIEQGMLKPKILETVDNYIRARTFEPIVTVRNKTASEMDLIHIGKNMKRRLDEVAGLDGITHVIIENQISPIASRMKTIQGMLAQYFIMNNINVEIDFVSSSHKLKQFDSSAAAAAVTQTDVAVANTYKQHKTDAIFYCSLLMDKNAQLQQWKTSMNTKKKDDLADCFLQGIWYIRDKDLAKVIVS